MTKEKIYNMSFEKVYSLLIQKVERKGKTKKEADELIRWLCGYEDIKELIKKNVTYGEFIDQKDFNACYMNIKGSICGIKVEEIEDPFMRKVRALDKVIDDLSKGKDVDKIKKKYE